jgi:hypothetical protein
MIQAGNGFLGVCHMLRQLDVWLSELTRLRKACLAFIGTQNICIGYGTAISLGVLVLDFTLVPLAIFVWLMGAVFAICSRLLFG